MHLNAEFQRIARRAKKAFLGDQCKEIEENYRKGRTRDLFTNIQKGRELLSDRIRVCFFTLRNRSVQGVGVRLGCSVQTCPVINVWFL